MANNCLAVIMSNKPKGSPINTNENEKAEITSPWFMRLPPATAQSKNTYVHILINEKKNQ